MITNQLATQTVNAHVLDVASLLAHEPADLLRQAANATAAGPDWYLTSAPPSASTLWLAVPILVGVEALILDGPLQAHCTLHWRTMNSTLARRGELLLFAVATATRYRPTTELSLLVVHPRPWHLRRVDAPRRRDAAHAFLRALGQHLELQMALEDAP